jgi:hypothetical protein
MKFRTVIPWGEESIYLSVWFFENNYIIYKPRVRLKKKKESSWFMLAAGLRGVRESISGQREEDGSRISSYPEEMKKKQEKPMDQEDLLFAAGLHHQEQLPPLKGRVLPWRSLRQQSADLHMDGCNLGKTDQFSERSLLRS